MSGKNGRIINLNYLRQLRKRGMTPELKKESDRRAADLREQQIKEAEGQRQYETFLRWSKTELERIKTYLRRRITLCAKAGERSFGVIIADTVDFPQKIIYY
jgi:hypothetical protein